MIRYLLFFDSYDHVFVGRPLWREDGSVLNMLLALASVVFLVSESLGTRDHIYCLTFETSLFVASYNSQGHGGGIRPRLGSEPTENTISNNSSIVACVCVTAGTYLPRRCLEMDISGSTIPAFRRRVTICKWDNVVSPVASSFAQNVTSRMPLADRPDEHFSGIWSRCLHCVSQDLIVRRVHGKDALKFGVTAGAVIEAVRWKLIKSLCWVL
jgi:hypothetical protein